MNFAGQIRFLPVSFVCSFFFFSRGFTSGPSIAHLSRTLAASLCLTSQKEWFAEKMRLYVSIRPGMLAIGPKQTSASALHMSAFGGKGNARLSGKCLLLTHSGHVDCITKCLLMTQSGY